jgi:hypothetical protein
MTAKEMAEEIGSHVVTISDWETGKQTLTPQMNWLFRFYFARKGAQEFGWSMESLIPAQLGHLAVRPKHPQLRINPKRESYTYAAL